MELQEARKSLVLELPSFPFLAIANIRLNVPQQSHSRGWIISPRLGAVFAFGTPIPPTKMARIFENKGLADSIFDSKGLMFALRRR